MDALLELTCALQLLKLEGSLSLFPLCSSAPKLAGMLCGFIFRNLPITIAKVDHSEKMGNYRVR